MWSRSRCLFIIVVYFVSTAGAARAPTASRSPLVPAIYVFGDSLVDNGNNNHMVTFAKADYSPYGVDFPDGATGRFSNGRTIADWIAEVVGLPHPPAFWSNPSPRLDWLTGFNYASSACGILKQTSSRLGGCFDLDQQVGFFENTITQVLKKHYTNPKDLSRHLSKSVLLFVIGNNDYLNNYFSSRYPDTKKYTPAKFADLLLSNVSHQLQRLYKLGARKVMFSEIAPVGCLSIEFRKHGKCNETKNGIVSSFNKGLAPLLSSLTSDLPGSQFVVAKTYKITHDIIINPSKYGFVNCVEPCCKAMLDGHLKCKRGKKPCNNRGKYCFWDPYHPTEALIKVVVTKCFNDASMCNIQQLLKG